MSQEITLTVIAKNEERCLERCLKSVEGAVDAVHVVDTGSTDRTVDIAETCGAKVTRISWPDSFAEARNVAIEGIDTGWILWLDADEWFPEGASDALKKLASRNADVVWLIREDLDVEGKPIGSHGLPRFWRAEKGWRFQGRIHEQLVLPTTGVRHLRTTTKFLHDGLAFDPIGKSQRNLRFILDELKDRPGQIYFEAKAASTLMELGDEEAGQALDRLEKRVLDHRDSGKAPEDAYAQAILTLVNAAFAGRPIKGTTARLALTWFGDAPAIPFRLAELFSRLGKHEMAHQALLILERHVAARTIRTDIPFHPEMVELPLFLNLAISAHRIGQNETARRMYGKVLAIDPKHPVANQNLALLR